MHLDFLSPRVERISADGTVDLLHRGGALGRVLRRPVTLIARELCSFALFEAAGLPRSRRRQAAKLHARLAAPYLRAGHCLIKAGGDYGLWWWDEDRLQELTGGTKRGHLVPESLAQPRGQSWRIVRLKSGYEAQLWRGSALIATAFRRERFDGTTWGAFVRLQRQGPEAPSTPPAPADLPLSFANREAFAPPALELTREQAGALAAGAVALACFSLGAFFWGQGSSLAKEREALETQTRAMRANTPQPEAVQTMDANQKALIAYHQIEARTNPLTTTGAAIGILALHELTPDMVEAKSDSLSIGLAYDSLPKLAELVEDFETSGYFYDIRPRADAAAKTLTLDMKIHDNAQSLSPQS